VRTPLPTAYCVALASLLLSLLLAAQPARAEAPRLFLVFTGPDSLEVAAERRHFEAAVTNTSSAQFAATTDVDVMVAECRTELGVGPSEERDCLLRSARRVMVDFVLSVEARPLDQGRYELALDVRNADGDLLRADLQTVEAASLAEAARLALPLLGARFVEQTLPKTDERSASEVEGVQTTQSHDSTPAEVPAAARFDEVSLPGDLLRWLRCPVGQSWYSKTCSGKAYEVTFEEAGRACPVGFRLPSQAEFGDLLVKCDLEAGGLDCDECDDAERCRGLFGDDEGKYWVAEGRLANLHNGDIGATAKRAEVRCVRSAE